MTSSHGTHVISDQTVLNSELRYNLSSYLSFMYLILQSFKSFIKSIIQALCSFWYNTILLPSSSCVSVCHLGLLRSSSSRGLGDDSVEMRERLQLRSHWSTRSLHNMEVRCTASWTQQARFSGDQYQLQLVHHCRCLGELTSNSGG